MRPTIRLNGYEITACGLCAAAFAAVIALCYYYLFPLGIGLTFATFAWLFAGILANDKAIDEQEQKLAKIERDLTRHAE